MISRHSHYEDKTHKTIGSLKQRIRNIIRNKQWDCKHEMVLRIGQLR